MFNSCLANSVHPPSTSDLAARARHVRDALPPGGLFADQQWRVSPQPFALGPELAQELSAFPDIDRIVHLAAQAGVRKSWGRDFRVYTENNVDATQVLLEACTGRPIERFVYASSSSVYGDDVAIPMREDARPQPVSP